MKCILCSVYSVLLVTWLMLGTSYVKHLCVYLFFGTCWHWYMDSNTLWSRHFTSICLYRVILMRSIFAIGNHICSMMYVSDVTCNLQNVYAVLLVTWLILVTLYGIYVHTSSIYTPEDMIYMWNMWDMFFWCRTVCHFINDLEKRKTKEAVNW